MIHVDRKSVPEPRILQARGTPALERLQSQLAGKQKFRLQIGLKLKSRIWAGAELHDALFRLFRGKCAYCETPLGGPEQVGVDHFRPKGGAMNLGKRIAPLHYWWLAYDWANLYAACSQCHRRKGSWFPVGRARAEPEARGSALAKEKPLLLDPCGDPPEWDLSFKESGRVEPATKRAEVSIDIYGLNRTNLREHRRAAAAEIRELVDLLRSDNATGSLFGKLLAKHPLEVHSALVQASGATAAEPFHRLLEELLSRTADNAPFAGHARQIVAARLN